MEKYKNKNEQYAFKANKGWNMILFLTRLLGLSAWEKKDFLNKGDLTWYLEEMNHSKSLKKLMMMPIKWI